MTALGKQLSDDTFEVQVIDDEHSSTPAIETRTIKTGINDKLSTEVLSGLKQGEKVVVATSDGTVESVSMGL